VKALLIKLRIYKKEAVDIGRELLSLPDGYLAKKGKFYYNRFNRVDTGITKKPAIIKQLCRKMYLLARKKQLVHNLSLSIDDLDKFDNRSPKELIRSLPAVYQNLPISYFYHPDIEGWLAQDYAKHPYPPTEWNYTTENGVQVRSKSEFHIATKLEENGIPYRYDAKITLAGKTEYPDFIIRNPFTGKTILWEHFGALHLSGYEKKMNEKMDLYLANGYTLYDTIISTFEYQVKNAHRIQILIEEMIL